MAPLRMIFYFFLLPDGHILQSYYFFHTAKLMLNLAEHAVGGSDIMTGFDVLTAPPVSFSLRVLSLSGVFNCSFQHSIIEELFLLLNATVFYTVYETVATDKMCL